MWNDPTLTEADEKITNCILTVNACDNELFFFMETRLPRACYTHYLGNVKSGNSFEIDLTVHFRNLRIADQIPFGDPSLKSDFFIDGVHQPIQQELSLVLGLQFGGYTLYVMGLNWGGGSNYSFSFNGVTYNNDSFTPDIYESGIRYLNNPIWFEFGDKRFN